MNLPLLLESVKPCPCCGENTPLKLGEVSTGLYVGHDSMDAMCVQCHSCGLRMIVRIPDEWPEEALTLEELEEFTLKEAIIRWNKRVPK